MLAPQPVKRGGLVYAFASEPMQSTDWKIYSLDRQLVGTMHNDAYPASFLADLAPGLYLVRVQATTPSGHVVTVTRRLLVE